MGSKSKICSQVCALFSKADHFYDLFGGGFSITHFMLLHRSSSYKEFHFNELRPGIPNLIKDAIQGRYNYNVFKPKWVSREEFFAKKETDPYIKVCWSFGNNGTSYLFGEDIEPYKKSLHNAIIFNEFDETAKKVLGMDKFKEGFTVQDKRFFLKSRIRLQRLEHLRQLEHLEHLERLERLQQLERLERLQQLQQLQHLERLQQLQQLEQLERLQQLHFYNTDYKNVPIKENSVIYCDIPYQNTAEYDNCFNHKEFFDWAASQKNPVFISEYNVSDNRFKCVSGIKKKSLLTSQNREDKIEKVYVNQIGYKAMMGRKQ